MRNARNVTKSWGTWYTSDGERADGPVDPRSAARTREALISGSRHGLGGAGPGLAAMVDEGLVGGGKLGGLF